MNDESEHQELEQNQMLDIIIRKQDFIRIFSHIEIMNLPEMADLPKKIVRTGYSHIAFSVGNIEIVDALTAELKADGYEVISGPRTTGDGYYESCIVAVEDNQIEITV